MTVFPSRLRLYMAALACMASTTAAVDSAHAVVSPTTQSRPELSSLHVSALTPNIPQHLAVRHPAGTYLPNTIIVKTRSKIPIAPSARGFMSNALSKGLELYNVESVRAPFAAYTEGESAVVDVRGVGRMYEITYGNAVNAYDVCIALSANPDVEYATPVFNRYPDYKPNDPVTTQQYALQKLQAEQAWDVTKGSADVLIAIIDTGVDFEHEDLAANLWTNPNETAGNNKDDDGNGKIDDVRGWDFVGNVSLQQIFNGQFQEDNDPKVRVANLPWYDVRSHGTTVAGAAAAVTDNAKGIAGMGFKCRYVPIKCGTDNGSAQGVYRGYEAILYAARLGADVINCSWGGVGSSPAELDIIEQATNMGSLVVAAAGNETMFTDVLPMAHYPSNYPSVLSVGSTQSTDGMADFSNFGGRTLIYAPGDNILTTVPGNQYNGTSGTSISSPIVAGVAALVKAVHPDWTPRQIRQQIRSTSDNAITGTTPDTRYIFYGRINAYRAVRYNKTFTDAMRVPGVELSALDVQPASAAVNSITSYEPTPVKITVKNYLAAAPDLRVSVRSLDAFTSFPTSTFSVGTVNSMAEQSFTLTVQLAPYTSWSSGTVDVLLSYKSGTYENFERISIPVELPSGGNQSTNVQLPLYPNDVQWQSAASPSLDVCWAAGFRADGGYVLSSSIGSPFRISNKPAFAIAARSSSSVYVGVNSSQGGDAEILQTNNGGSNWTNKSVSSITGFINGIYFFDNNAGLLLGDPASSRWGVGRTTDGGLTWTAVNSVPTPTANETGLVGATGRLGDKVWFGTSKGRLIYSPDRGQSWSAATIANNATILAVSFGSSDRGVALYRAGSDASLPVLAAATTDGGKTWTANVFNFSTVKLVPIGLYSPGGSMQTIVVGSGSEMMASVDNGRTWTPHYTGNRGVTLQAAGSTSGSRVRVWTAGGGLGYTESTAPRERVLSAGANSIAFGAVMVGSTATRSITVTNTGVKDVHIANVYTTGGTAEAGVYSVSKLSASYPITIKPNASLTIDVDFVPAKGGYRTSSLKVESDADPDIISVALTGIGQAPTVDVPEYGSMQRLAHYPQPASERLTVSLDMAVPGVLRAEVIDLPGTVVWSADMQQQAGSIVFDIPVDRMASGVYLYRLLTPDGHTVVRSFVVQH